MCLSEIQLLLNAYSYSIFDTAIVEQLSIPLSTYTTPHTSCLWLLPADVWMVVMRMHETFYKEMAMRKMFCWSLYRNVRKGELSGGCPTPLNANFLPRCPHSSCKYTDIVVDSHWSPARNFRRHIGGHSPQFVGFSWLTTFYLFICFVSRRSVKRPKNDRPDKSTDLTTAITSLS